MATAGTLEYLIKIDSSSVQGGLNNAESKVKGFGDKLSAWAVAKGKVIGGLIEKAGSATVNFVKDSVNERREFDKSMAQVAATLGKSTAEVKELSSFARKMGAETAFSATEAAQALNYMALAGYDTEKSMRMLPTVLNLAAAGDMELARASDMVTDAQSALGLSIEETETMVDQMAKTASKTNTSVEQLGDAFLTVGGTAKMMKGGTTELSAVLGVLADNGIKGSEGGTALRNILLSLSAPTDKAAKELKKLGINVFDSQGKMKDMPTILQDINKATSKMTQEQRTNFLSEVFNKRDLKSIEALLGTSADRWAELFNEIENSTGAANQMAKTQLDNLEGDLTIFKSAFSEAKLSIVEGITPALRKLTQRGTIWVQRLTNAFNQKGLAGAVKEAGSIIRGLVTDSLGVGSDASWVEIGKAAAKKVKDGLKNAFANWKIKAASFIGIENANDATWKVIANGIIDRIKSGFKNVKVKVADFIGVENEGELLWSDIAKTIVDRIKAGIGSAKLKIADLLGVEEDGDASWITIGKNILDRIKTGIGNLKLKIADIVGVENDGDTVWSDIAKTISDRFKNGFKNVSGKSKIKLANLLGLTKEDGSVISDPQDTSWEDIGGNIYAKIKSGIGKFMAASKVKLSSLLGFTDANGNVVEAEWGEIGKSIIDKVTKYVSGKGGFLKKLLLGDNYTEESTWSDVVDGISGAIEAEFGEGGLIDTILGKVTEKGEAVAKLAGLFMSKIGEWLTTNSDTIASFATTIVTELGKALPDLIGAIANVISDPTFIDGFTTMVTGVITALAAAADKLIPALAKILTDPSLWAGIGQALESVFLTVLETLGLYKREKPGVVEAPEEKIGERKLHGSALPMEVIESLAQARKIMKDNPEAIFMDTNGNKTTPRGAFEEIFRETLKQSGFGTETIDALWTDIANASDEKFQLIMQELLNASMENTDKFAEVADETDNVADQIGKTAKEVGKTPGVIQGVNNVIVAAADSLEEAFKGLEEKVNNVNLSSGDDDDGEHAKGLWSVPFDNYKASLHRDEMVLTASQARDYRAGTGGSSSGAVVAAIQGLRNDLNNLKLVVGQKVFGRAVVNYGGNNINNYLGKAESRLAAGYGT